jgi:Leucine-rich repeat (LRR) protein
MKNVRYRYSDGLIDWIKMYSLESHFEKELEEIETLDLSWTDIEVVPKEIDKLTNLKSLSLRSTSITALPESILSLEKLEALDLRYTDLTELPEGIGEMSSLQHIDIDCTDICELPDSMGRSKSMKSLIVPVKCFKHRDCPLESSCTHTICPIQNLPKKAKDRCERA